MKKTASGKTRGRPRSESPRAYVWPMRFSKEEAEQIDRKVQAAGKPRGEWIREKLLEAAA
jgi:hypothetical protein